MEVLLHTCLIYSTMDPALKMQSSSVPTGKTKSAGCRAFFYCVTTVWLCPWSYFVWLFFSLFSFQSPQLVEVGDHLPCAWFCSPLHFHLHCPWSTRIVGLLFVFICKLLPITSGGPRDDSVVIWSNVTKLRRIHSSYVDTVSTTGIRTSSYPHPLIVVMKLSSQMQKKLCVRLIIRQDSMSAVVDGMVVKYHFHLTTL